MNLEKIGGFLHDDLNRPADFDINSLAHLKHRYDFLKDYANLNISNDIRVQTKKIFDSLVANVSVSRNIYLCYLATLRELNAFSEQNQIDVLKLISKKQRMISEEFSSTFVQCMILIIKNIQIDPSNFAYQVFSYFSMDISDALMFGYTVFPAIFGYFSSQELTNKASEFILKLFEIDSNFIILENVIVPFLLSAHSFIENLWNEFHKLCVTTITHFTESKCFSHILESIKQSVTLLTQSHIDVIQQLLLRFECKANQIIITEFLYKSFLMYFSGGNRVLPKGAKNFTNQCFLYMGSGMSIDKCNKILDIFVCNIVYTERLPKNPETNLFKKFPYLLSSNDIRIIYDIISDVEMYKNAVFHMKNEREKFIDSSNIDLFQIDVFADANPNNNTLILPNPMHSIYTRSWNAIIDQAKSKNWLPIPYFIHLRDAGKLPILCQSFDFEKFAYQQAIIEQEQTLIHMTNIIDAVIENKTFESYKSTLTKFFDICLYWNASQYIASLNLVKGEFQMRDLLPVLKSLTKQVFENIDKNLSMKYHVFSALLDNFKVLVEGPLLNIQKEFVKIVSSARLPYRPQISQYPSALMIITRFSRNISDSCNETLGRIYNSIIVFTEALNYVAKATDSSLIQDFFNFGISAIKNPAFLASFIVLEKIITDNALLDIFGPNLDIWLQFCSKIALSLSNVDDFLDKFLKFL